MIFDRIFFKFVLAGLANTLVGSGIMFVMYNVFGFSYWVSSAMNYTAGSVLSFFLNKYWTFRVKRWSMLMVVSFTANIVISYLLAYKTAKTAIYFILAGHNQKLTDNAAMLAGICFFTGLNYLGQRFIVFRRYGSANN
jgi:putative flippase GtrA